MSPTSDDPGKQIRQRSYLRALEAYIPEIEIYYGHFLRNTVRMPLDQPSQTARFVNVVKTEEKGSDVNLAIHLLNDAWRNAYDCAVVVSNDSDLAEALRLVREQNHKFIGVINPGHLHPSVQLKKHADFVRPIRKSGLSNSLLPDPIPGTSIHKPKGW